jgi:hypothetical protein
MTKKRNFSNLAPSARRALVTIGFSPRFHFSSALNHSDSRNVHEQTRQRHRKPKIFATPLPILSISDHYLTFVVFT